MSRAFATHARRTAYPEAPPAPKDLVHRPATALRRALAFTVDYVGIVAWAGVLFALSSRLPEALFATPDRAHATSFLLMTLPVTLAFAAAEASSARASFGKRVFGLAVVHDGAGPGLGRSLARNALKFLPWEIAHTFVHRMDVWPETVGVVGSSVAIGLMIGGLIPMGTSASRRTVWDRLTGCAVVRVTAEEVRPDPGTSEAPLD